MSPKHLSSRVFEESFLNADSSPPHPTKIPSPKWKVQCPVVGLQPLKRIRLLYVVQIRDVHDSDI